MHIYVHQVNRGSGYVLHVVRVGEPNGEPAAAIGPGALRLLSCSGRDLTDPSRYCRFCADDECSGRGRSRVQIVQIRAEHTTTGPSDGSTLKWIRLTQPARRSCQHLGMLPAGYGGMVRTARLALACCPRTGTADAAAELAVPDADMEMFLAMPAVDPRNVLTQWPLLYRA